MFINQTVILPCNVGENSCSIFQSDSLLVILGFTCFHHDLQFRLSLLMSFLIDIKSNIIIIVTVMIMNRLPIIPVDMLVFLTSTFFMPKFAIIFSCGVEGGGSSGTVISN